MFAYIYLYLYVLIISVTIPSSKCDIDVIPVDGIIISSKSDQVHSSCTIKLEADLDHFMVNIKHLKLSCGQYVKLYYSTNSNGKPDVSVNVNTQHKYKILQQYNSHSDL